MADYGAGVTKAPDLILEEYDSWQSLVDRAALPERKWRPSDESASRRVEYTGWDGKGWYGTQSWEQCLDIAHRGWPEGAQRMQRLRDAVVAKSGSILQREEAVYQVSGGMIDIGAYLGGQPECFMEMEPTEEYVAGSGKILRLVVNVCAASAVSADVLFHRGAAMVALADSLELAGRRVEIIIAMNSKGAEYRAVVKRPDQPLQIDQLAMAVAHPSSFRRIGFGVMEQWPTEVQVAVGYGYGQPFTSQCEGDVILPSAGHGDEQFATVKTTIAWVRKHLKEQGVELE